MNFKTVLSVFSGQDYQQDLRQAADFCERHNAHLTTLLLSVDPDFYISEYQVYSEAWIQQQRKIAEDLDRNASKVREILSKSGLSFDVHDAHLEIAWVEDEIAERALYSDLVLIGAQAARNGDLRRRTVGGALFRSPTPILFNRTDRPVAGPMDTVVVAWDSGEAAARAVRLSLQFLKNAADVHVTLVDPMAASSANGEEPGADVAAYLARHGVKVTVDRLPSGGRTVDEVLRQQALDVGADLVVMGAYKHSRLQEKLFGGVTRSMLETANVALFLSH